MHYIDKEIIMLAVLEKFITILMERLKLSVHFTELKK
jgi:hypothetical protein